MIIDAPTESVRLVSPTQSAILAIDELREQLRSLQISSAEFAAPSESTQSMDDHVLVSLDSGLESHSILALMAPNSPMAQAAVSDPARYAFPTSNCAISTSNLRTSSRLWLSSPRLTRIQLAPSPTNDSQPMYINVPVATLMLQDDSGKTELHSRILPNRSRVRS
jgi:hypothetical protein